MKKVQKVVIYGDSDFSEQVKYQLDTDRRYKVVAFTVDKTMYQQNEFMGLPVYKFQTLDNYFKREDIKIFIAIGYKKMNTIREKVTAEIVNAGYDIFTYISKQAFVGNDVKIGDGCFICEFVSIKPKSVIGKGVIIFPNSSIGHYVIIEDYSYLSIGVAVGGNSIIKKNSFIGMNATIKNGIYIENMNIIGTASNVINSTLPNSVYVGNPAQRINEHNNIVNVII